jgi:hypothetical protein
MISIIPARRVLALTGAFALAACAYERPPMSPSDPGMAARPMEREVFQQTFPSGGTPAQGLQVGTPAGGAPASAPVRQPGNRP